jgi:hypothetical protein
MPDTIPREFIISLDLMHGGNVGVYPAAAVAIHGAATSHVNCFPHSKNALCIASCIASCIALCIAFLHHADIMHCIIAFQYALHHVTLPSSTPPCLIVVFNLQDIIFLLLLLLCFPFPPWLHPLPSRNGVSEKNRFHFLLLLFNAHFFVMDSVPRVIGIPQIAKLDNYHLCPSDHVTKNLGVRGPSEPEG